MPTLASSWRGFDCRDGMNRHRVVNLKFFSSFWFFFFYPNFWEKLFQNFFLISLFGFFFSSSFIFFYVENQIFMILCSIFLQLFDGIEKSSTFATVSQKIVITEKNWKIKASLFGKLKLFTFSCSLKSLEKARHDVSNCFSSLEELLIEITKIRKLRLDI